MPEPKTCSKCGKNPVERDDETRCNECLAAYQREYNNSKIGKAERAGWIRGARAMQESIARGFEVYRTSFAPDEIAHITRTLPLPEFEQPAAKAAEALGN